MKRADIEVGRQYACKYDGQVWRCRAEYIGVVHVTVFRMTGTPCLPREISLKSILMPWPQYEAEQERKRQRDAAVQEERERHAQLVEAQIDEQWAFNLQLQELRGELAARGVGDYKHSSHGVTLSWADLAKVLGMKAP